MLTGLVLTRPHWALPFHIFIDALDIDLGVFLGERENQIPYSIYFVSKNISPIEINYTVIEKEFLLVVHAINKFRHYITDYEIFLHTDNSNIIFLMNKPITTACVTIWLLLLQEFNITIIERTGKCDIVADFLSRRVHTGDTALVTNDFLDENLFFIYTYTPWYENVF